MKCEKAPSEPAFEIESCARFYSSDRTISYVRCNPSLKNIDLLLQKNFAGNTGVDHYLGFEITCNRHNAIDSLKIRNNVVRSS
jgi:hypothetical protein